MGTFNKNNQAEVIRYVKLENQTTKDRSQSWFVTDLNRAFTGIKVVREMIQHEREGEVVYSQLWRDIVSRLNTSSYEALVASIRHMILHCEVASNLRETNINGDPKKEINIENFTEMQINDVLNAEMEMFRSQYSLTIDRTFITRLVTTTVGSIQNCQLQGKNQSGANGLSSRLHDLRRTQLDILELSYGGAAATNNLFDRKINALTAIRFIDSVDGLFNSPEDLFSIINDASIDGMAQVVNRARIDHLRKLSNTLRTLFTYGRCLRWYLYIEAYNMVTPFFQDYVLPYVDNTAKYMEGFEKIDFLNARQDVREMVSYINDLSPDKNPMGIEVKPIFMDLLRWSNFSIQSIFTNMPNVQLPDVSNLQWMTDLTILDSQEYAVFMIGIPLSRFNYWTAGTISVDMKTAFVESLNTQYNLAQNEFFSYRSTDWVSAYKGIFDLSILPVVVKKNVFRSVNSSIHPRREGKKIYYDNQGTAIDGAHQIANRHAIGRKIFYPNALYSLYNANFIVAEDIRSTIATTALRYDIRDGAVPAQFSEGQDYMSLSDIIMVKGQPTTTSPEVSLTNSNAISRLEKALELVAELTGRHENDIIMHSASEPGRLGIATTLSSVANVWHLPADNFITSTYMAQRNVNFLLKEDINQDVTRFTVDNVNAYVNGVFAGTQPATQIIFMNGRYGMSEADMASIYSTKDRYFGFSFIPEARLMIGWFRRLPIPTWNPVRYSFELTTVGTYRCADPYSATSSAMPEVVRGDFNLKYIVKGKVLSEYAIMPVFLRASQSETDGSAITEYFSSRGIYTNRRFFITPNRTFCMKPSNDREMSIVIPITTRNFPGRKGINIEWRVLEKPVVLIHNSKSSETLVETDAEASMRELARKIEQAQQVSREVNLSGSNKVNEMLVNEALATPEQKEINPEGVKTNFANPGREINNFIEKAKPFGK